MNNKMWTALPLIAAAFYAMPIYAQTHPMIVSEIKALNIECQTAVTMQTSDKPVTGITKLGTAIADAPFDTSAAEIVSYDKCSDTLFVVNSQAQRVDVMSLDATSTPTIDFHIDLSSAAKHAKVEIGAANSVSTHYGLVAVAIENKDKQADGIVALYRSDNLNLITTYQTGALPDMVAFSADGRYLATANEGEPSPDYRKDPEGSITLIDLATGLKQAKVTTIGFNDFNQGSPRHNELDSNVRISAPNATVAQDLEPEYLTFADNGKLYVALQENNALAVIDVDSANVDAIYGLGGKSWQTYQLDASNKDKKIGNLQSYPQLEGLYMPDSIDSYTVAGKTYIVTANEGDGREYGFDTTQKQCDEQGFKWDGSDYAGTADYDNKQDFCIAYVDEIRGKKLDVDPEHPLSAALEDNKQLARLKVINPKQTVEADDVIQAYGARSFSIWDESGKRVFDSGDEFARKILELDQENFNSTNDSNDSADDRSDDKGSEPEAIKVIKINGRFYAFIGLERQGGIMVYDVTEPSKASFIAYNNNRNFDEPVCTKVDDGDCDNDQYNPKAGDLGPESIAHITRYGQHFIAVGNEVSGTTSVYRIEF